MTEKRFTLKEYLIGDYAILDNGTEIAYASHKSAFTFCELLNKLYEKNEQLKSDNKDYVKRYSELFDEYKKNKKENDQLEEAREYYQENFLTMKTERNQFKRENVLLKFQLELQAEENEQLKCGNKNLKSILNDFINICNRLQANPTDKQTLAVARDMLQNMGKELEE